MDWQVTHMITDMAHDYTAHANLHIVTNPAQGLNLQAGREYQLGVVMTRKPPPPHPAVKTVTARRRKHSHFQNCGLAHISKLRPVLILTAELHTGGL